MKVIGIDQSYKSTGVVILDNDEVIHFEAIVNKQINDKFQTALNISTKILHCINTYKPEKIAIEGLAFMRASQSQLDLAGLQYTIITDIIRNYTDLQIQIIPPTTLKKFATGCGKAEKNKMIDSLPDYFKTKLSNDGYKKSNGLEDIADAYHLANYARSN